MYTHTKETTQHQATLGWLNNLGNSFKMSYYTAIENVLHKTMTLLCSIENTEPQIFVKMLIQLFENSRHDKKTGKKYIPRVHDLLDRMECSSMFYFCFILFCIVQIFLNESISFFLFSRHFYYNQRKVEKYSLLTLHLSSFLSFWKLTSFLIMRKLNSLVHKKLRNKSQGELKSHSVSGCFFWVILSGIPIPASEYFLRVPQMGKAPPSESHLVEGRWLPLCPRAVVCEIHSHVLAIIQMEEPFLFGLAAHGDWPCYYMCVQQIICVGGIKENRGIIGKWTSEKFAPWV